MNTQLHTLTIDTPLGTMRAIADDRTLHFLEFVDNPHTQHKIETLLAITHATMTSGSSAILAQISTELDLYFQGLLPIFTTPITSHGSPFQQRVWQQLQTIAYGTTHSYTDMAVRVGTPLGYRAVAQANAANRLAIIIPCHRIIAKNGTLSGYSGGGSRKEWLLKHEQKMV